jgi:Holliday junction DNA helicase RuvA
MIGRLTGTLVEKLPPTLCIDVSGVGYEVDVPMSTLYAAPEIGARISLYTHLAIREDAHLLYGFASLQERAAFRQLIKISGVGARIALAVLSSVSVTELTQIVVSQEASRLIRVPGIGKKTAERLLLEMRGKLSANLSDAPHPATDNHADIMHALLALGYSDKESVMALKGLPEGISVSEGIRQGLKRLVF